VISLLPPGNIKIRFFVPEAELPKVWFRQTVRITCDGCDGITGRVSFIAKSAEYTPPVIYSLEERAKLVFLVEARTDTPEKLRVGQPVTVSVTAEEASR
jgi:HlyD family secretion protein